MFTLNFLGASAPLTKSFWIDQQGEIQRSTYPSSKHFTSYSEPCTTLRDFYEAVEKHAALGHCLIKGKLHRDLDNESRAGATRSDDTTNWLCLDLDGAPFETPKAFMHHFPELRDVSYVIQYSASHGLKQSAGLSCHIFVLLDGKVPAAAAKNWLTHLNLSDTTLREGITLTRTAAALHWPVDITACQNDKLLYIAPPMLGKGVKSPLKATERIQYVPGKQHSLPVSVVLKADDTNKLKDEAIELRNGLRVDLKLKPLTRQTKWVGELEVQPKPGEAIITGKREDRGFVYFNLNGGDSWGYYHPTTNFEYILNFKGEPAYATRELLPDYYKDCKAGQRASISQPGQSGEVVLAFRDKRTAQYFNGTWHPATKELYLYPARSELQLNHWLQNHDLPPMDVVPVWDLQFNPQSDVILDEDAKIINTYIPTKYMQAEHDPKVTLDDCPLIKKIMLHAVSGGNEDETFEHWLNWLAVVFQMRVKPKTAWILHGTEGTGKGVIVGRILRPLLGERYVATRRASELEEKYNGWLETALIGFIDEVEVSASGRKDVISGDLRNFITEDTASIRKMNVASIEMPNYTGLIFGSNKPAPVMIQSNDRRYNVGFFQPKRLTLNQRDLDVTLKNELPAFMSYIMTRPADRDMAATTLHNQAHRDIVETSRTSLDTTSSQLANGDLMALWDMRLDLDLLVQTNNTQSVGIASLYHDTIKREIQRLIAEFQNDKLAQSAAKHSATALFTGDGRLTRDELMIVFEHCVGNMPRTPNKFTSLLRHYNIRTERMRIKNGEAEGTATPVYGLRVEWRVPSAWLIEMRDHFAQQDRPKKLARVK